MNATRKTGAFPPVVPELGELGEGAIVSKTGLAELLGKHPVSIDRAVSRGELPPPCRLTNGSVWTVGAIIRHLEQRLEAAAREAERDARRISKLSV